MSRPPGTMPPGPTQPGPTQAAPVPAAGSQPWTAMDVAGYLYPWDVAGDPAAADLFAQQGFSAVVVAAHYHATRALTPRHPQHRVVTAAHSAAYYPTSAANWAGSTLRPPAAGWLAEPDSFGGAVAALTAVGLPVHAWLVLLHRDPATDLGADSGEQGGVIVNAYGDRYSWSLCPSRQAVRDYAAILSAEVAARPGIAGLELEACGWYGFEHLSSHDKTAGVSLSKAQQYLFSLCFCSACAAGYREHGIDVLELAARVRGSLDTTAFRPAVLGDLPDGDLPDGDPAGDEHAQIAAMLGADLAVAVGQYRQRVADQLRAEVVAAARSVAAGLEISLHADPRPERSSAYPGLDPATTSPVVDRLVLNCWDGPALITEARSRGAGPMHANLLAVSGMGGRPDLLGQAERARQAGANGVRLYHAGLASAADLAAMAELTAHLCVKGGPRS